MKDFETLLTSKEMSKWIQAMLDDYIESVQERKDQWLKLMVRPAPPKDDHEALEQICQISI